MFTGLVAELFEFLFNHRIVDFMTLDGAGDYGVDEELVKHSLSFYAAFSSIPFFLISYIKGTQVSFL